MFCVIMPLISQINLAGLLIDTEITRSFFFQLPLQVGHDFVHLRIQYRAVFSCTRNYEWSSRFVDQYGIDFVNNGIGEFTLHTKIAEERHVVTQIVKSQFIVRCVHNIASISVTLFFTRHVWNNNAHRNSEKIVDRSHPLCIASSEIVVDRDDVN